MKSLTPFWAGFQGSWPHKKDYALIRPPYGLGKVDVLGIDFTLLTLRFRGDSLTYYKRFDKL